MKTISIDDKWIALIDEPNPWGSITNMRSKKTYAWKAYQHKTEAGVIWMEILDEKLEKAGLSENIVIKLLEIAKNCFKTMEGGDGTFT